MNLIPCTQCNAVFFSAYQIKEHRFENHYDYYSTKYANDVTLLIRKVGALKK